MANRLVSYALPLALAAAVALPSSHSQAAQLFSSGTVLAFDVTLSNNNYANTDTTVLLGNIVYGGAGIISNTLDSDEGQSAQFTVSGASGITNNSSLPAITVGGTRTTFSVNQYTFTTAATVAETAGGNGYILTITQPVVTVGGYTLSGKTYAVDAAYTITLNFDTPLSYGVNTVDPSIAADNNYNVVLTTVCTSGCSGAGLNPVTKSSFTDNVDTSGVTVTTVDVPEPASMALLGLGLAGIGAIRRRRSV